MDQINANLILAPTRLNRPLPTLYARKNQSFNAMLTNVPDDVVNVSMRVFIGTAYSDISAGRRPDGTAVVYILGSVFNVNGSGKYEVRATDARGNSTALGMGYIYVEDFSTGSESVVHDSIKDDQGNYHTIKAVPDGEGGYTSIIGGGN